MALTIKNLPQEGFEIDVKRLALPFIFKSRCPICKKVAPYDLSRSEDYPSLGLPQDFYFGCKCGVVTTKSD